MSETWQPSDDAAAANALGRSLDAVGYTEDAVCELLGDDAYDTVAPAAPIHDRRLPHTPLATAIRACFLGYPVSRSDADEAFGADGPAAFAATGLASLDRNRLVPRGRILPVEDLLVASDGYSRGVDDPPGYVATYTPTARQCACLTPRRRVARALDLGTGGGAQALLAARHARQVVATDLNPRALAFTRVNAGLNGFRNVETRLGSLFDPVEGERFDLVVCNAPFVVSPESRFVYRDGGLGGDELSARVVDGAASHLTEGGLATLLVSWVAADPEEPDERVLSWVEATGCDAWILGLGGSDPLAHAAGWNDYLEADLRQYAAVVDEWTAYFDRLGVAWITEGAVLLRRRSARDHRIRVDAVDEELEPGGAQVQRVLRNLERLAELRSLRGARVRVPRSAVLEEERSARTGKVVSRRLRLDEGTQFVQELTPSQARALAQLDGAGRVADLPQSFVRELLERGFLELV